MFVALVTCIRGAVVLRALHDLFQIASRHNHLLCLHVNFYLSCNTDGSSITATLGSALSCGRSLCKYKEENASIQKFGNCVVLASAVLHGEFHYTLAHPWDHWCIGVVVFSDSFSRSFNQTHRRVMLKYHMHLSFASQIVVQQPHNRNGTRKKTRSDHGGARTRDFRNFNY